jgi:hypothetical protein
MIIIIIIIRHKSALGRTVSALSNTLFQGLIFRPRLFNGYLSGNAMYIVQESDKKFNLSKLLTYRTTIIEVLKIKSICDLKILNTYLQTEFMNQVLHRFVSSSLDIFCYIDLQGLEQPHLQLSALNSH